MIHRLEIRTRCEGRGANLEIVFRRKSAMGEAKTNGSDRGANVDRRHDPFQPMVTGSVEEVAHSDDRNSLAGKVQCQSRGRATEDANDRVEFLATILQIGAGHGEIGAIQSRRSEEECPIFPIPEFVLKNDIL